MMATPVERPVSYPLEDPKNTWLKYNVLIKIFNKLGIDMNILNLVKNCEKPRASISFKMVKY